MPNSPKTHGKIQYERQREWLDSTYEEKRKRNPALKKAQRIRSSSKWSKLAKIFLKNNPLCFDPLGYHITISQVVAAQEVHHVIGLTVNPKLAFVKTNLASLCKKCHMKIEAKEKLGKPTQHLFLDSDSSTI